MTGGGPSTRAVHAGLPPGTQGEPFLPGPAFAAPFHLAGDPNSSAHVYGRYGAERRAHWGGDEVPEGLIRFSAGCEGADDLLADVLGALEGASG